jgi:hypothetical protein
MAVSAGRKGRVTVVVDATSEGGAIVAEMGEWAITGMSLPMTEYSAFGDTVTKFKPGIMDPGGFTFSGYFDGSAWATTTNSIMLLERCLNNGYPIGMSTAAANAPLKKLRLWANTDTDYESYGYWSCIGSAGSVYLTGMELGTAKDGVGTVTFSGKVATGKLEWSTST